MADNRRQRIKIRECGAVSCWMLFAATAALLFFDYVKRIFDKPDNDNYWAIYVSIIAVACSFLGILLHFPHHRRFDPVFAILKIVFVIAGCAAALCDFILLSYFAIPSVYARKIAEPQELRSRIQNWVPKDAAASALNTDPLLQRHSGMWSPGTDENRQVAIALTIALGFCASAQFVLALLCALTGCFECFRCCCRRKHRNYTQEMQPMGTREQLKK